MSAEGMRTRITVVDGADGLTPEMLRKRPQQSHCTHWEDQGEVCCECGGVFPHAQWPPGYGVPCAPENVECPTCEGARWDWKRVADDGVLPDDPVGEYPCPDCTPENVECLVFECHCQCHLPIGFRLKAGQAPPPIMRPCSACVAEHPTPENVDSL